MYDFAKHSGESEDSVASPHQGRTSFRQRCGVHGVVCVAGVRTCGCSWTNCHARAEQRQQCRLCPSDRATQSAQARPRPRARTPDRRASQRASAFPLGVGHSSIEPARSLARSPRGDSGKGRNDRGGLRRVRTGHRHNRRASGASPSHQGYPRSRSVPERRAVATSALGPERL